MLLKICKSHIILQPVDFFTIIVHDATPTSDIAMVHPLRYIPCGLNDEIASGQPQHRRLRLHDPKYTPHMKDSVNPKIWWITSPSMIIRRIQNFVRPSQKIKLD
jgi:hypothetical protein